MLYTAPDAFQTRYMFLLKTYATSHRLLYRRAAFRLSSARCSAGRIPRSVSASHDARHVPSNALLRSARLLFCTKTSRSVWRTLLALSSQRIGFSSNSSTVRHPRANPIPLYLRSTPLRRHILSRPTAWRIALLGSIHRLNLPDMSSRFVRYILYASPDVPSYPHARCLYRPAPCSAR